MRHAIILFSLAAAVASCNGPVKRPDGGEGLLPVGAVAPDFQATTKTGEPIRLSAMLAARDGSPAPRAVVVYFYPKDETPGCTKEACGFRDAWAKFQAARVGLVGVSRDTEKSHREFRKHHDLPFPLAADEDGSIAKAYGVKSTLGMSQRVSFLVGPDRKVKKVWPKVDPAVHAGEVLSAAGALGP